MHERLKLYSFFILVVFVAFMSTFVVNGFGKHFGDDACNYVDSCFVIVWR